MILVTGASGNAGKEVVRHLQSRHVTFRIGDRRAATRTHENGIDTVPLDFLNPSTYKTAVQGCTAVFLLRPPAISNTRKTLNVFLDVARDQGVSQVVFVSVAGAGSNPLVPHHAVEQHLRAGPSGWTILRPGFFAQNLGDAYREDIRKENRIYVPAGQGRIAFVDVRDVAELAVNALIAASEHQSRTYTLTGPQAFSFVQVADMLSAELGRPVRYQAASVPAYVWHLLRRGMPPLQILVQTVLHVGLRFGQAEQVNPSLADLLGHPPLALRDYVRDYRSLWLQE